MTSVKSTSLPNSESNILRAVCDYLAFKKYFFWRNNTTGVYDVVNKHFRRTPMYHLSGVPDIIMIAKGKFVGIEVKRKGTYQSPEQKEFQRLCEQNSGAYCVVRSIDDIIKLGY